MILNRPQDKKAYEPDYRKIGVPPPATVPSHVRELKASLVGLPGTSVCLGSGGGEDHRINPEHGVVALR